MVASTHWLASGAGMAVLERGGNAADAAVAAGFVLQVVEPHLNGPGGEAPILLYDPGEETVHVLAGQGPVPAAASIDGYRDDLGLDLVPGTGLLAATVPGAFAAWTTLLERWGTWSLADVLEFAIGYAESGYPLLPTTARTVATVETLFREHWPTSAAVYLAGGLPGPGQRFHNPALAATYRRLAGAERSARGPREQRIGAARDAFYSGFVAEAVARFCADSEVMDTSGRRHRGLLTGEDLASWSLPVEAPVTLDYAGYTVCKTGPWGQGPVLLQQLALLAGFDLASVPLLSADWVHTVVECAKLAFADREAWYGDPAEDVPLAALLDPAYAEERRSLVAEAASYELRPGAPGGRPPQLPRYGLADGDPVAVSAGGAGEPTVLGSGETRGDTCHVDVVDAAGMMISATPSGGWLQSSPVIPDLGFCLGTRAQMCWLQPGLASSLVGGRRPRTTLSPTLALRDGAPWLAFGTPGGDQQDQWQLAFFLGHVHGGLDLQQAVDAPMFHTTAFPSSFYPRTAAPGVVVVEERLGSNVVDDLRRRGHQVEVAGPWSQGRLSAVARDGGWLKAAANPRGDQGYAVGR
ncbi:MAG: gamma-glutamyltransferase [Actinomycetota bacterium]|nr:gamma-glutamyltransferase [Actinomycetota bacterium]